MTDWITVKELAQIQGITPRAVRKSISQNKYVIREVNSKYEVFVHSLSSSVQNLIDFEKRRYEIGKSAEPKLIKEGEIIPPHAKKIALARFDLVNLWIDFKKTQNRKTEAGTAFIEAYNTGKTYPVLFETLSKVSTGTIYRWSKALKAKNDYIDLVPDYNYGESSSWDVNLTKEEELIFKNLLLSPNKINIGKAGKLTKFILNKKGMGSPTCERNFRRYADNYKRKHYDKWILAREGQKALRDKVEPYITRDISKLEVGDVLVADGHRLAVQVINPFTGRPCRAALIGYLDWKSTALVGFEIMLEENTQCIASALRNSIINLGKIPKICYQDNGKAFRAKFFTGDLQEVGINGLFANLGIIPVFAQPYNAKAKPIERFFREFQESFERLLPSFVGANIDDKPAYMQRNEKFHKENHSEFIPTIEQLIYMVTKWQEYYNSQGCPHVKGNTIGEVFDEGRGKGVEIKQLDDLMLAQEYKTIHRNGIKFLNADYYNERLYGLKERVLIKYRLFDLSKIRVYTPKGKFLCEAQRMMPLHPMANYLGDVKDVEELKQALKQKKRLENKTKDEVKKLWKPKEKIFEWQNVPEVETVHTAKIEPLQEISQARPVFEHRYERYDWHLKNGFDNDLDVAWFKEYELTEEYCQIFGKEEYAQEIC